MSPSLRAASRMILIVLATTAIASCGRKGPPRPPEDVLPEPIADLSAAGTANGVELSWSRPATYADGSRMTDLGGFMVERAGMEPHAGFQKLAVLEVNDRDRFRQVKRFKYLDGDTMVGTRYTYRVVSFTLDRYFSKPSNVVTAERLGSGEEKHASFPATER